MKKNESKQAENNIVDYLKIKEKAFVLFYASWCPFSKRFLPIFEDFAKGNPKEYTKVLIDDKPDLCKKYGIEYYPTVLFFIKGELQKRLDAKASIGLSKEELKEFITNI